MHCVEAMPSNVEIINKAAAKTGLDRQGFVVTQATSGSQSEEIAFPVAKAGTKDLGITDCSLGKRKVNWNGQCTLVSSFTLV
mmetsp:Transcript_2584/g.2999  ORF Transcript_2584/g.2999 Transcript_2584/m.2999 type:complete len:82 (+) Transcript_2584:587-832(+)